MVEFCFNVGGSEKIKVEKAEKQRWAESSEDKGNKTAEDFGNKNIQLAMLTQKVTTEKKITGNPNKGNYTEKTKTEVKWPLADVMWKDVQWNDDGAESTDKTEPAADAQEPKILGPDDTPIKIQTAFKWGSPGRMLSEDEW